MCSHNSSAQTILSLPREPQILNTVFLLVVLSHMKFFPTAFVSDLMLILHHLAEMSMVQVWMELGWKLLLNQVTVDW